jgi:hypothetical protein
MSSPEFPGEAPQTVVPAFSAETALELCIRESPFIAGRLLTLGRELQTKRADALRAKATRFQGNWQNCSDGALAREHWEEYLSLGHEIQQGNVIPRGLQTTGKMPSRRALDLFGGDRRPVQADDVEEGSLSELFRDEAGYNFERILERFPPLAEICAKWQGSTLDRVQPAVTHGDPRMGIWCKMFD